MSVTRRVLTVGNRGNWPSRYEVTFVDTFERAKEAILRAEDSGQPPWVKGTNWFFDFLDLPVKDEAAFWSFVDWLERTGRKYPISVWGPMPNPLFPTECFVEIRDKVRDRGFQFLT